MGKKMFDKEFLKTLTVLYVEDDETIRTSLGNILKKVFKEVVTCVDGKDGVTNYELYTQDMDMEFDAIISDINMPNMNGLEMVKKIREYDQDIPVVMTTAHGEANYLMEAIKVNVSGYTLKPIDTKELLNTVQKFCEIKRNQRLIQEKEAELSEYMDVVNGIATIVKVDKTDTIVEANEYFCALLDQEEDELIGTNILQVISPDSISTNYREMKSNIKTNESWKGKLKLLSHNDEVYHLRSTNIPKIDPNTGKNIGYISIGFVADDEEQEKKETLSKARQNILAEKQKVLQLNKQVKTLKTTKSSASRQPNYENIGYLREALEEERKKNHDNLKQIEGYEYEISLLKDKLLNIVDNEKAKKVDTMKRVQELSRENAMLQDNLIRAQNEINALQPRPKYVE
jgi:PAS domain S-box-containing protein